MSIILGLWPLAGITTIGVQPNDADETINAAIDCGIKSFDTAYSYGYQGESDVALGRALLGRRDDFEVIGKVGQRWNPRRERIVDGSPKQLTRDAEESLRRMKTDYFDTLFLHSPDPSIDLESSADAMQRLMDRELCRGIGICNMSQQQLRTFQASASGSAIQCPLNLLQTESQKSLIPPAVQSGCRVYVFWTLMKGLLAGHITRDHQFAAGDSRPKYEIFQGNAREHAHKVVDGLSSLGNRTERTVAQLAVGWTLSQPGISGALVGSRRPQQIRELAESKPLSAEDLKEIERITISVSDE